MRSRCIKRRSDCVKIVELTDYLNSGSLFSGNYWNIYNLPKYFDVSEQPQLSLDDFHDCVNTAFSRLPEMVRSAASYAYVSENCDHSQGKSKFYAEQVFAPDPIDKVRHFRSTKWSATTSSLVTAFG